MTNLLLLLLFTCLGTFFPIGMRRLKAVGLRQTLLTSAGITLIAAVLLSILCLFTDFSISGTTLLIGLIYGVVYILTVIFYYITQQNGPLSYTAFVLLASMIIPTLSGYFFWHEPLTTLTLIGIGLFLVSFYLICVPRAGQPAAINRKWILFAVLTFLFNGAGGVIVKYHQTLSNGQQTVQFNVIGYAFSAVLCLIAYLPMLLHDRRKPAAQSEASALTKKDFSLLWCSLPILLFIAFGNSMGNTGITFLVSRMPASYLFTVFNGGMQMLVTLYSALVLKEDPGRRGWLGLGIGLTAMVLMNL